jgi:S-adenosylmethionine:tRNA ribosyltransferase-isomerase
MTLAKNLFHIPENLNADHPIELMGRSRDDVRLMVLNSKTGATFHHHFHEIGSFLLQGDVLVLNNSRTIPSVLRGKQGKREIEIRLSRRISDHQWEALIVGGIYSSKELILFPNGVIAYVLGNGSELPLVLLEFSVSGQKLYELFYEFGGPIRYEYIHQPWPLEVYQTVYASIPGSVEMPSAGRAFSWRLLNQLKQNGIDLAFLQLHAGLSYYGNDQWPLPNKHPESFHIPAVTADVINKAKQNGRRIIAVGTTVVRTLETVADSRGFVKSGEGITTLYIKDGYKLKTVNGLLTGLHEPEASHLDLLSTFVDKEKLISSYHGAIDKGYLWHEFGDMNLILPMVDHE